MIWLNIGLSRKIIDDTHYPCFIFTPTKCVNSLKQVFRFYCGRRFKIPLFLLLIKITAGFHQILCHNLEAKRTRFVCTEPVYGAQPCLSAILLRFHLTYWLSYLQHSVQQLPV